MFVALNSSHDWQCLCRLFRLFRLFRGGSLHTRRWYRRARGTAVGAHAALLHQVKGVDNWQLGAFCHLLVALLRPTPPESASLPLSLIAVVMQLD